MNRFEKLQSENGTGSIFYLREHSNPIDFLYNVESGKRAQMYDRKSYPTILFNGGSIVRTGMSDAEVDAAITKEWKKKVQFSTQLEGRFVADSNKMKIDFVGTAERLDNLATDKLKYAFVAFESGFEEGTHVFNHVVRLFDPSAQGGSLRFGNESKKNIKRTLEMNSDWIPENTGFVFVMWDAETLEVHGYSLWEYVAPHVVTDFTKPVPSGKSLKIEFDTEIDKSSIGANSILLTTSSGETINFTAKANGNVVTIEPDGGLKDGEYVLYLLGGLKGILSKDVHPLSDNQIFAFSAETIKAPLLTTDSKMVDFGTIKESATKIFNISNSGNETLTGKLTTTETFISVTPEDFSIEPGSSQTVTVKADVSGIEPAAKSGFINIESNGGEAQISVTFTYEKDKPKVAPILEVMPIPPETENSSIIISGKASVGSIVSFNGKRATVDKDGVFKVQITVLPGVNTFKVVAELDGLTTEKTLTIFRYIQISLQLDSKTMYVGSSSQTLASAPTASSPPLPADLAGSTYMPIRPVAEALFSTVGWEAATQKVTLTQNTPDGKKKTIELWIGKKQAKINGADQWIDSKQKLYPAIVGGKTMLPLRFTANALGAEVAYDSATKKITIKYPAR